MKPKAAPPRFSRVIDVRSLQSSARHLFSGERLMVMMAGVADVIRRHVPDRETRARIADEIRHLTETGIRGKTE